MVYSFFLPSLCSGFQSEVSQAVSLFSVLVFSESCGDIQEEDARDDRKWFWNRAHRGKCV